MPDMVRFEDVGDDYRNEGRDRRAEWDEFVENFNAQLGDDPPAPPTGDELLDSYINDGDTKPLWPEEYVQYSYFKLFDKYIREVPDEVLTAWLYAAERPDIEFVRFAISPAALGRILKNLPRQQALELTENFMYIGPLSGTEIENAAIAGFRTLVDILMERARKAEPEKEEVVPERSAWRDPETRPEADSITYDLPQKITKPKLLSFMKRYRDLLDAADDRLLQVLLRDLDMDRLAVAMLGFDEEIRWAVFNNMSKRTSKRLMAAMKDREDLSEEEIFAAVTDVFFEVLEIMKTNNISWQGCDFRMV